MRCFKTKDTENYTTILLNKEINTQDQPNAQRLENISIRDGRKEIYYHSRTFIRNYLQKQLLINSGGIIYKYCFIEFTYDYGQIEYTGFALI